MKLSPTGRALTESFENLRLTSYQDQRGTWTIGFGHTGRDIGPGMIWSVEHCNLAMMADVEAAETAVNNGVNVPLSQGQFDALVDFTFNLGTGSFLTSTLRKLLNGGNYKLAAAQFPVWNKVRIDGVLTESKGLSRRRAAEQALFLGPTIA